MTTASRLVALAGVTALTGLTLSTTLRNGQTVGVNNPSAPAATVASLVPGYASGATRSYISDMLDVGSFKRNMLEDRVALPVAACFAPGTPEERMAEVNLLLFGDPDGGIAYQLTNRWPGTQGDPVTLRWSYVPDGLTIPSIIGEGSNTSRVFSTLDSQFAAQGGRATWKARIQSCFDRWAQLAGLRYTWVRSGTNDWDDGAAWGSGGSATRGDVRIGMKPVDGPNNTLAFNVFPDNGGDMVLDSAESWGNSGSSHRFLRNTIMHEHGHGMGLLHCCPANGTKLMEPALATNFDGPQQDDIRGAQRHYGDTYEGNNNTASATPITPNPTPGTPVTFGTVPNTPGITPAPTNPFNSATLGLDANGEIDYYRFTVSTAPATATVTVTPIGSTYDSSVQNGNGSCSSGNNINALAQVDLELMLIATDGTTILAQDNDSPAGQSESVSNVALNSNGNYYIRVFEEGTPTQNQLYTVTVSLSTPCSPPTITQQPQSVEACDGDLFVVFSTAATGQGTINYQWQKDGANIPGATLPSVQVSSIDPTDAGVYRCVVTDNCGTTNTNGATLTVLAPATITSQPANLSRCTGQSATFSVTVTGSPTITYQWRKDGVNISGATSSSYTINPVSASDAGVYSCRIFNPCSSILSDSATLTVSQSVNITTHPQSATRCLGESVSFTVAATGSPTLTYQWRKNDVNIGGATSPTYSIAAVVAGDAANYTCVVTNPCGSVTSNAATLTIGGSGPTINQHPQSQTACQDGSVMFTVVASGSGLTYQ